MDEEFRELLMEQYRRCAEDYRAFDRLSWQIPFATVTAVGVILTLVYAKGIDGTQSGVPAPFRFLLICVLLFLTFVSWVLCVKFRLGLTGRAVFGKTVERQIRNIHVDKNLAGPSVAGEIPRILPIQTFEIMSFLKDVSHNDPQFYHNDIEMKFFSFISLFSAHYLQFGLMFSLILLQLVLLFFEFNQQLFENVPQTVWLMVLGLPFLIVVAVSCYNYYEIRRSEK